MDIKELEKIITDSRELVVSPAEREGNVGTVRFTLDDPNFQPALHDCSWNAATYRLEVGPAKLWFHYANDLHKTYSSYSQITLEDGGEDKKHRTQYTFFLKKSKAE
jgi:hypothetical protein